VANRDFRQAARPGALPGRGGDRLCRVLHVISALYFGREIRVSTTWPVFDWLQSHFPGALVWATGLIARLTAVVLVLPIGVAVPGSSDDASHFRHVVMDSLRAGLPDAALWVFDIPCSGPVGDLWNHWAATSVLCLKHRVPIRHPGRERPQSAVGIANGVLMFC
jgi:hypothetical protein